MPATRRATTAAINKQMKLVDKLLAQRVAEMQTAARAADRTGE